MDWLKFSAVLLSMWVLYHLGRCVYNIFFHPLRSYPGPALGAATQLTNVFYILRGVNCKYLCDLHEKYGDVVRTGPNELSYRSASAMKTIYGGNPGPDETFQKNMIANIQETRESNNVFFATGERHARYRRLLAPVYSESAIRAHESMIRDYCDQLIKHLRRVIGGDGGSHCRDDDKPTVLSTVDMVPWTNFVVSDILSHSLFGSGLSCLEKAAYHPWVAAGYQALIESTYIEAAYRLWPYHLFFEYVFTPSSLKQGFRVHSEVSRQKLQTRVMSETRYPFDLPSFVAKALSKDELFDNINVIATAAGETTSSTLSAALYYLTHNPEAYRKLTEEIRGAFARSDDISAASSASLPYLKATILETLRIHPTIPVGLHRITPKSGRFIDGKWVPGGTWVSIANLAACRAPSQWRDPERFAPERWLGAPEFENDNREISRPYSIGVRNCIGMSFANSQLRIILSHLLLNFDFEAQRDNVDPHNLLEYGTWQVEPLNLHVREVRG